MADTIYATVDLVETSKNENPPPGFQRIQAKPDGLLYVRDSQGVESVLNNVNNTTTFLNVNGGDSSTVFEQYLLRLDFGSTNGSTINPDGVV